MNEKLLPHYWKMIALGIFVLTMATWFINIANPGLANIDPYKFGWIVKIIILLSLVLFISTKEKAENERTAQLRVSCLFSAVSLSVFFLIMEVFMEVLFEGENAEVISGYELMMVMLVYYYISFYIRKNIKTVSRG